MAEIQFDPKNANILVPTQNIQQVSPWHAARTSIVVVNPDPDVGDVFKVGSRYDEQRKAQVDLYCLAKPALMRIAAAAGINWNWRESGPVALTKDYVCYKAVAALRLPDGSWLPIMAQKEIDLEVVEDETYEANLKKAREYAGDSKKQSYLRGMTPEKWAEVQTKSNMVQWRKNKLMRAETGAMLRVIRAALGMKSQYTREELQKPFIVPRIDFSPDYNDPQVRQALIEHGVAAMASLFGAAAPAALPAGNACAARPVFEAPAGDEPDAFDVTPEENEPSSEHESRVIGVGGVPVTGPVAEAVKALLDHHEQQVSVKTQEEPPADLFAQAQPAVEQASAQTPQQAVAKCADCGKDITSDKVAQYSTRTFGRPLCYKCQQAAKNGGSQA